MNLLRYEACDCGFMGLITDARATHWTCPDCTNKHDDPVEVLDEQEATALFDGADEEMELALR